ncbi:hypothetical protein CEXT_736711 [Caerostris extrusa]|uniref:Uncharacterized protein n=1 Tax=Caerostris extrusa TaxID=172846 RepID=A0AAV4N3Q6_CAEEX|nr:hypothetical protein CEXT_736711 [Caerostris extrusa]
MRNRHVTSIEMKCDRPRDAPQWAIKCTFSLLSFVCKIGIKTPDFKWVTCVHRHKLPKVPVRMKDLRGPGLISFQNRIAFPTPDTPVFSNKPDLEITSSQFSP